MELPDLMFNEKTKKPVFVFRGLNRNPLIADDEFSACFNISMSKYSPLISCRPPRETLYTLSSPQSLYVVGSNLVWVDGTDFKYNNVVKGTVTAGVKSMVDFNGKILIFPDKKYYDYGTNTFGNIGAGVYPAAGSCPDIDYACVHMNRVFGVKNNTVYASAWGKYNDWTTFAGQSTDAWAKDVASEGGNFVGIIRYQNHPVIFKSEQMYEVYNNKPDFVTQPGYKIGALSNRAIIEANKVLYFVGKEGVYAYRGGDPVLISENLFERYSDAVLGTDGRLLYVSLYNGTEWKLYVYDTFKPKWWQEDLLHVVQFAKIGEYAYALDSSGALYKFNSGSEIVNWSIETKDFTEEMFNKKNVDKIRIRVELDPGTSFNVYKKVNNRDYTLEKSYSATGVQSFSVILKVQMADRNKIKLAGTGGFKLYALQYEYTKGSDE
jgi:hypothetical protein